MCIVKDKIESSSFLYLEPWFYNNELSIRCELGIGNDNEYFINAENRALEILNILFDDSIDCVFTHEYTYIEDFNENIIFWDKDYREPEPLFVAEKTIELEIDDLDKDIYEDLSTIKRNLSYNVPKIKIIDAIKQMFKNQSYVYHFVSYKNNLIYSIYDDRGCDIVFFKKEDYKKYYSKLEKYFLEYDKELMEKRLKAL